MDRLKPREQGDIGELSAMHWLAAKGAIVYVPIGHSPDVDVVADFGGALIRVQVKTCTRRNGQCFGVQLAARGGNQSWDGVTKYFDPNRFDYLFALVGDGRAGSSPRRQSNHGLRSASAARSTPSSRSSLGSPFEPARIPPSRL